MECQLRMKSSQGENKVSVVKLYVRIKHLADIDINWEFEHFCCLKCVKTAGPCPGCQN